MTIRERIGRIFNREQVAGYLFLVPNMLGFMVFTFLPVFASALLSFFAWDILRRPEWVGFGNYVALLGFHLDPQRLSAVLSEASHWWDYVAVVQAVQPNDPEFWHYLFNTIFLMMNIPLIMGGSLFLAIVMNQKLKGRVLFRTLYFLPSICAGVALLMLWKWIYDPDFGLLNWALSLLGVQGPRWLQDPFWSKPSLMLMGLWGAIGGRDMILYLAALQGVPGHLYEAADIDGATGWQKFRHITFPMISPTSFFIFVMAVISGFQGGFMSAFILTRGGPAGSTTTLGYYIYTHGYELFQMGYAAAVAWFLFVLVLGMTLVNWKFGGQKVHY